MSWSQKMSAAIGVSCLLLHSSNVHATGMYNPIMLLEDSEYAAIKSPEFWFELEMKDLAKEFKVPEKSIRDAHIEDLDLATFDEAVKSGSVKLENAAEIREILKSQRAQLGSPLPAPPSSAELEATGPEDSVQDPKENPVPSEPSERSKEPLPKDQFTLYQRGAFAYQAEDYADARKAWMALLELPAGERQSRSVWAAYMLGRLEIQASAMDKAPAHFQKCREWAAAGDNDALGLAAASYGWEAFAHKISNPMLALELYLKQLATGDNQGFISIRQLVRSLLGRSFDVEPAADPPKAPDWSAMAQDALLQRIITRFYLAMGTDQNNRYGVGNEAGEGSPGHWLQVIEGLGKTKAEDADRLAWLAYRSAQYALAQRWLKLAPAESRLSLWLSAKLALREGKLDTAAAALAKAQSLYGPEERLEVTRSEWVPTPRASAKGDQAMVLLAQSKFIEAFAAFIDGGFWVDAAYVGERVMTLKELHAYVDEHYPKPARRESSNLNRSLLDPVVKVPEPATSAAESETPQSDDTVHSDPLGMLQFGVNLGEYDSASPKVQDAIAWRLRWMLARRMVREDQEAAARPYFPGDLQPVLDTYIKSIARANDKSLGAEERARGWWEAAWIARWSGMDLMGTEAEPDNAVEDGMFAATSILRSRRTGMRPDENVGEDENADATTQPKLTKKIKFGVPPSAEEKARLAKSALPHDFRNHFRWIAAALAKKAAALLEDGSEEKADVLNTAGTWMFNKDVKGEEWFFFEIKRACPKTVIGKQVLAKTHTLPLDGPWSGQASAD